MTSFHMGSAIIDKYLQIKNADEGLYRFICEDNFTALGKNVHPDDLPKLTDAVASLEKSGCVFVVFRLKGSCKSYRWVLAELENDVMRYEGEALIRITLQDVKTLEQEMEKIKSAEEEYVEYFGLLDELFFSYDIEADSFQIFFGAVRNAVSLFKGSLEEWIMHEKEHNYIDEESLQAFEQLCHSIRSGARTFSQEVISTEFSDSHAKELNYYKGKTLYIEENHRKVIGCIATISMETKKKEINYSLESMRDPGTDLLNKKAITNYARRLLESKPEHAVSICIIDLDNFKMINDNFGHMKGDEVLVTVADLLKNAVGRFGVVGRIGGDEMMVVLEQINTHSELRSILRTIRSNIEWSYKGKLGMIQFTCSIGCATYPAHGQNYDDLFDIADKMLYRAKMKGKNRYIIYMPELHGSLKEGEVHASEIKGIKYNKQGFLIRATEDYLHKQMVTREQILKEACESFGIESVYVYYETLASPFVKYQTSEKAFEEQITAVEKDGFLKCFNDNGLAVVDHPEIIQAKYTGMYQHLVQNQVTGCILYKMAGGKGYVCFYRNNPSARKWEEEDKTMLNLFGKIIELSIVDR